MAQCGEHCCASVKDLSSNPSAIKVVRLSCSCLNANPGCRDRQTDTGSSLPIQPSQNFELLVQRLFLKVVRQRAAADTGRFPLDSVCTLFSTQTHIFSCIHHTQKWARETETETDRHTDSQTETPCERIRGYIASLKVTQATGDLVSNKQTEDLGVLGTHTTSPSPTKPKTWIWPDVVEHGDCLIAWAVGGGGP